ncbi:formate dehydrogenase subunit delta [Actinocrispum wychmicini]|uniref:Formate dehydrogenase subunit delta n=1 Tax=Actinocrispum wychmicini TaxID=1213861 RepID=A0A4R2K2F9_9PSEU|nr:formate dehydrogenase subunit delta [Actinocrispum wychmicini]TCO65912.1 formate dehydrogenase subunit delta [Actinocrispum wychmicini]
MTTSPQGWRANEIAIQFHHLDSTRAAAEIANHIRLFWDPRMKTDLIRLVASDPGALDPLVIAAAEQLSGNQ